MEPFSAESNVVTKIREVGCSMTNSVAKCQQSIAALGVQDMTAADFVQAILMMITEAESKKAPLSVCLSTPHMDNPADETWNPEVFSQACKEVVAGLDWQSIAVALDTPWLMIRSRSGLSMLVSALSVWLGSVPLPVDIILHRWKNARSQFSWISQMLRNPDVLAFSDCVHTAVQCDGVKLLPDEPVSKEIQSWQVLELVIRLVELYEVPELATSVNECFQFPLKNCPVLLASGLMMVPGPMTQYRQDLLFMLMPALFGGSYLPYQLLVRMWNDHSILRSVMLRAMLDWYDAGADKSSRLSRILEIANALEALPIILNMREHVFTFELACVACKVNKLRLDKWILDKVKDHGEEFAQACIAYIRDRCLLEDSSGDGKSLSLPTDTVTTVLVSLQNAAAFLPAPVNTAVQGLVTEWRSVVPPNLNLSSLASALGSVVSASSAMPTMSTPNMSQYAEESMGVSVAGMGSAFGLVMPTANSGAAVSDGTSAPPGGGPSAEDAFGISATPLAMPGSSMVGTSNRYLPSATGDGNMAAINGTPVTVDHYQYSAGSGYGTNSAPSMSAPAAVVYSANAGMPGQADGLLGAMANMPAASGWGAGFASNTALPQSMVNGSSMDQGPPPNTQHMCVEDAMMLNLIPPFPEDVQEEANMIFRRLFTHPPSLAMTLDQMVELMEQLAISKSDRDKNVGRCMMKNLLEEYRFFGEYPTRELGITSALFGIFIQRKIFTPQFMGVAMRLVMDALHRQAKSKLYEFGLSALEQFKTSLRYYPQYCQTMLTHCPDFCESGHSLLKYVKYGSRGEDVSGTYYMEDQETTATEEEENSQATVVAVASSIGGQLAEEGTKSSVTPSLSHAKVDTLVNASDKAALVQSPPEAVQQQISFLFNNLSQANMSEKVDEMKALVNSQNIIPWVAQYFVVKRISAEFNFHNLYFKFMQELQSEALTELVIEETYRNIKVLFCVGKREPDFSDKTLLKNLGHWLGMITIRCNRPIRRTVLDLKALIIEAYMRSESCLLYVVPFVTKILESCKKSTIFHPLCPWSAGLIRLLVELHQQEIVRLTLEFEVEMLCRNLRVDLTVFGGCYELRDGDTVNSILKSPQLGPLRLEELDYSRLFAIAPHLAQHLMLELPMAAPGRSLAMMPASVMMIPEEDGAAHVAVAAAAAAAANSMVVRPPVGCAVLSPQPRFHYAEAPVDLPAVFRMFEFNPNIALFQLNPLLKQTVRPAVEQAVQEVILATRDRTLKVPLYTIEMLVRKDFASECSEDSMMAAAHNVGRVLGAAMALFHCREPLYFALLGYLKQQFYAAVRNASPEQQRMVDEAAQTLTDENSELCLCYVMKYAAERLVEELDKVMVTDCELRRGARNEGRTYLDVARMQTQDEALPPILHANPSTVALNLQAVYMDNRIPGFKSTVRDAFYKPDLVKPAMLMAEEAAGETIIQMICRKVDSRLQKYPPTIHTMPTYQAIVAMRDAMARAEQEAVHGFSAASVNLLDKLTAILFTSFNPNLNAEMSNIIADVFVTVARSVVQVRGDLWVQKQISKTVLAARNEPRLNLHAIDLLIRNKLVDDDAMAFTKHVLRLYLVEKRIPTAMMNQSDWMQALSMAQTYGLMEDLSAAERDAALMESVRPTPCAYGVADGADMMPPMMVADEMRHRGAAAAAAAMPAAMQPMISGGVPVQQMAPQPAAPYPGGRMIMPNSYDALAPTPPQMIGTYGKPAPAADQQQQQPPPPPPPPPPPFTLVARSVKDELPPGYVDQVESALREWVGIFHSPDYAKDPDQVFLTTFAQIHLLVKNEDFVEKFSRICTEMCADLCHRIMADMTPSYEVVRSRCCHTLDAFAGLIVQMIKHTADRVSIPKSTFISKAMAGVARVICQEQDVRRAELRTTPFLRLLAMMFYGIATVEAVVDEDRATIICAFTLGMHLFRPEVLPAFLFCWMDLIGNRQFMGCVLVSVPGQRGYGPYAMLLIDLFRFLAPFLRNLIFTKPVSVTYRGALRILLVLLHDFPELLCDYHYSLCDAIPANCVQLRNLIISAYPRSLRLPDPFIPIEKLEAMPEMNMNPRIAMNITQHITPSLKADLDGYLTNRAPVSFLSELRSRLQVSNQPGQKYCVPMLNAIVLYVGMRAIRTIQAKEQRPNISNISHTAHMDILQNLAVDLDSEGRYLFFNAIVNQLRYPNSHTLYFGCALLYLFSGANAEAIQEQITRVLFERLVSLRPHPWGLMMTFIELINNSSYHFWNHFFVHCSPEVERFFQSLRNHRPDGVGSNAQALSLRGA